MICNYYRGRREKFEQMFNNLYAELGVRRDAAKDYDTLAGGQRVIIETSSGIVSVIPRRNGSIGVLFPDTSLQNTAVSVLGRAYSYSER